MKIALKVRWKQNIFNQRLPKFIAKVLPLNKQMRTLGSPQKEERASEGSGYSIGNYKNKKLK